MISIRLLGAPAILRDGEWQRPPRGRKAWAVLGYVLLADRPPSRKHLAELLFGAADDPLGALRWTLAELRRVLGRGDAFVGDPVRSNVGVEELDLAVLDGGYRDPGELLHLDGDLLDGLVVGNATFETWLAVERSRVSTELEARLREVAVALLAAGRATDAVAYASRAVARNPFDEGNHVNLVRCLATAGDSAAAERQVAVCEDLLRNELGVEVSPALRGALNARQVSAGLALPRESRAAVVSQLEAGRAAIAAGAVDAGLQCLRRAVDEAARHGDDALRARTLAALGAALVHALRGCQEASVLLHRAIEVAERIGDRATAVAATRSLGVVEVHAGRRTTAEVWLQKAQADAETDVELAAIFGTRGLNASDIGDYPTAFAFLGESVERASNGGDDRQRAWSLSITGRANLLRGERSQADHVLQESFDIAQHQRWLTFLPWPKALLAELDLQAGRLDDAQEGFEGSWALACQVDDPCWEAIAARGLGLLGAARGDYAGAVGWLDEALRRSQRTADRYQWMTAHVLDAAAATALDHGDQDRADRSTISLAALAARCSLGEFVVRAQLHRHRLGDPTALAAAQLLGRRIDNPTLTAVITPPARHINARHINGRTHHDPLPD